MSQFSKNIRRGIAIGAFATFGAACAFAAPEVVGWSVEEGGMLTFNVASQFTNTLQAVLSESASQVHYSVAKNGVTVFDGTQNVNANSLGKTKNQVAFSFTEQLKSLVEDGTLSVGDPITVTIDAITYGDDEVEDMNCSRNFILTNLPSVAKFYPDAAYVADFSKQELKANSAFYVYLTNTALSCDIEFYQNDVKKGTYTVSAVSKMTGKGSTTATLPKQDMADYISEMQLTAGDVVVRVTKIQVDEETALEGKLGWGIWSYLGTPGSVVSVSAPEKILSWFPESAPEEESVFSLSTNKALNPQSVKATIEYGRGEINYFRYDIPVRVSDDKKTVSVDFRNRLLNVDYLAPGVVWYDESGNVIAPPSTIGLEIEGLVCEDGSGVLATITNPETGGSITLTNRYSVSFNYEDISLATPRISAVQFYDSENPLMKHDVIEEGDDMIQIDALNLDDVKSFKVRFYYDGEGNGYPAEGSVNDSAITASLPQEVLTRGIDNLLVTLSDLEYAYEDGVNHTVKPFACSSIISIPKVASINELKQMEADVTYSIYSQEGLAVTWADKNAGVYLQDDTNGIKLYVADGEADKTLGFRQGQLIQGKIVGKLLLGGQFEIDLAQSNYEATDGADVTKGHVLTATELSANDNGRLVTIQTDDEQCVWDETEQIYILDNGTAYGIAVDPAYIIQNDVDMGGEGKYEPVESGINSITGIYSIQDGGTIWLRTAADIAQSSTGVEAVNADENKAIYTIDGLLRKSASTPGMYIINGKKVIIRK